MTTNEIDYPALTASQNAKLDRLEREMREAIADEAELRIQEIQAEINALAEEMADTLDERREAAAIFALERTGLSTSDAQAAYDAGERAVLVENARDDRSAEQRARVFVPGGFDMELVSTRRIGRDIEVVLRTKTIAEAVPSYGPTCDCAPEDGDYGSGFHFQGCAFAAAQSAAMDSAERAGRIYRPGEERRGDDRPFVSAWRRRELERQARGESAGKDLGVAEELPRYDDETDAEYDDRSGKRDDDYLDGFRLGSGQESGTLEELRSEWYYRGFEAGVDHRAKEAKEDAADARMRAREEKELQEAEAREEEILRTARQMDVSPDDAARIRRSDRSLSKAVDRAIAQENAAFLDDPEAQAEAERVGDLWRLVLEAEAAELRYAETGLTIDAEKAVEARAAAVEAGWKGETIGEELPSYEAEPVDPLRQTTLEHYALEHAGVPLGCLECAEMAQERVQAALQAETYVSASGQEIEDNEARAENEALRSRPRSAKTLREIRNPVLGLPAVAAIEELDPQSRKILGALLRELGKDATSRAEESWTKGKGPMAAYWKAVGVYARHIARVVEPR
jgi:hypothetical protein